MQDNLAMFPSSIWVPCMRTTEMDQKFHCEDSKKMVKVNMAFTITISILITYQKKKKNNYHKHINKSDWVLRFDHGRKTFVRSLQKGLIKIQTYKKAHTPTNSITFMRTHGHAHTKGI